MINAVHYARKNGFTAVACGHTHFAEEQFINGIQYLNTGAWTEQPTFYVRVTTDEIVLENATDCIKQLKSSGMKTKLTSDNHQPEPAQPVPIESNEHHKT